MIPTNNLLKDPTKTEIVKSYSRMAIYMTLSQVLLEVFFKLLFESHIISLLFYFQMSQNILNFKRSMNIINLLEKRSYELLFYFIFYSKYIKKEIRVTTNYKLQTTSGGSFLL